MALLQRLSGCHVGQHHELLDQLVAVEPLSYADLGNVAVIAQPDQALRQIEVERPALLACRQQRAVGAVKRLDNRFEQLTCFVIGTAVHGPLDAGVGQASGRAHHGAVETVEFELPFVVDPHFRDQHRAVLGRHE
jgi:hypothetical protein